MTAVGPKPPCAAPTIGERTSDFRHSHRRGRAGRRLAQAAGDVALRGAGYYRWGRRSGAAVGLCGCQSPVGASPGAGAGGESGRRGGGRSPGARLCCPGPGAWAEVEREIELALPMFRAQGDLAGEMAARQHPGDQLPRPGRLRRRATLFRASPGPGAPGGPPAVRGPLSEQPGQRLAGPGRLGQSSGLPGAVAARVPGGRAPGRRGGCVNNLATLSVKQGDLARAPGRSSSRRWRSCGRLGIGARSRRRWRTWASATFFSGDYEAARENCQQALEIARELGSRSLEGLPLTNLGHALAGLGQLDEARQAYQAAVEVREDLNQYDAAMEARAGLARVALAAGSTLPAGSLPTSPRCRSLPTTFNPKARPTASPTAWPAQRILCGCI